jgi:hypothetical protein
VLTGSETGDSSGVTAAPARLLTGLAVGLPTDRVVCVGCATQLTEGRAVTVYGYRRAESLEWDLRRCYCVDCAPTTIDEATPGVTELLARAWLGSVALPRTRTHRPCLTDVEVVATSGPQEGRTP